jgi:hypothetical protein
MFLPVVLVYRLPEPTARAHWAELYFAIQLATALFLTLVFKPVPLARLFGEWPLSSVQWKWTGVIISAVIIAGTASYAVKTSFHNLQTPAFWLMSSIAQDLFYAGFVFALLSQVFSESKTVVFTALLFGGWHLKELFPPYDATLFPLIQFVYSAAIYWVLLTMRKKTGNNIHVFFCHIWINFLQTV